MLSNRAQRMFFCFLSRKDRSANVEINRSTNLLCSYDIEVTLIDAS